MHNKVAEINPPDIRDELVRAGKNLWRIDELTDMLVMRGKVRPRNDDSRLQEWERQKRAAQA